MGTLRAALIGIAIGLSLSAPSLIYFRREIIESWKAVLGFTSGEATPRRHAHGSLARYRQSKSIVVLQAIVLIISGVTAIGAEAAVLAITLVVLSLLFSLSLGLHILDSGLQQTELSET